MEKRKEKRKREGKLQQRREKKEKKRQLKIESTKRVSEKGTLTGRAVKQRYRHEKGGGNQQEVPIERVCSECTTCNGSSKGGPEQLDIPEECALHLLIEESTDDEDTQTLSWGGTLDALLFVQNLSDI